MLGFGIFSDTEARAFHLTFALFLAFACYPAFRILAARPHPAHRLGPGRGRDRLRALSRRVLPRPRAAARACRRSPTSLVSVVGVVLLIEASRRAEGPWMPVISIAMLLYVFAGPYLPAVCSRTRAPRLGRAASHFWLTSEGVFGVALGVSTSFIFLFVLFGALLDKAGAGNYFIQVAFSLLGQFRGGPAKAAVVSSGMTGMISGSSVANVVTAGTFTIPLMKRVGYSPTQVGAIECAAGVNGQLMPPVMGAAAFLMAEYVGITYADVVRHAIMPALLTYGALFYVVDLEAVKAGMTGLPGTQRRSLQQGLIKALITICSRHHPERRHLLGLGWTKRRVRRGGELGRAARSSSSPTSRSSPTRARHPDLPHRRSQPGRSSIVPDFYETVRTGLHYLLPGVRPDLVPDGRGDVAGPRRLLGRRRHGGPGAHAEAADRFLPPARRHGARLREGCARLRRRPGARRRATWPPSASPRRRPASWWAP